jgi:hypothetical protein
LDVFDSAGKFDAILSQHVGSNSKIAAKGAILIRIVDFVSKITENNKQTQMVLYMLGKSHANKAIRPWQYSVFIQTLLNTISSRLGVDASSRVMESWVHLFAYVMQHMLPPAIDGRVVETEVNINTSSAFSEGNIAAEVQEAEEVRSLNRKLKSGSNSNASSVRSSFAGTNGAHDPSASLRLKMGAVNKGLSNGLPPKATTASDRYQ